MWKGLLDDSMSQCLAIETHVRAFIESAETEIVCGGATAHALWGRADDQAWIGLKKEIVGLHILRAQRYLQLHGLHRREARAVAHWIKRHGAAGCWADGAALALIAAHFCITLCVHVPGQVLTLGTYSQCVSIMFSHGHYDSFEPQLETRGSTCRPAYVVSDTLLHGGGKKNESRPGAGTDARDHEGIEPEPEHIDLYSHGAEEKPIIVSIWRRMQKPQEHVAKYTIGCGAKRIQLHELAQLFARKFKIAQARITFHVDNHLLIGEILVQHGLEYELRVAPPGAVAMRGPYTAQAVGSTPVAPWRAASMAATSSNTPSFQAGDTKDGRSRTPMRTVSPTVPFVQVADTGARSSSPLPAHAQPAPIASTGLDLYGLDSDVDEKDEGNNPIAGTEEQGTTRSCATQTSPLSPTRRTWPSLLSLCSESIFRTPPAAQRQRFPIYAREAVRLSWYVEEGTAVRDVEHPSLQFYRADRVLDRDDVLDETDEWRLANDWTVHTMLPRRDLRGGGGQSDAVREKQSSTQHLLSVAYRSRDALSKDQVKLLLKNSKVAEQVGKMESDPSAVRTLLYEAAAKVNMQPEEKSSTSAATTGSASSYYAGGSQLKKDKFVTPEKAAQAEAKKEKAQKFTFSLVDADWERIASSPEDLASGGGVFLLEDEATAHALLIRAAQFTKAATVILPFRVKSFDEAKKEVTEMVVQLHKTFHDDENKTQLIALPVFAHSLQGELVMPKKALTKVVFGDKTSEDSTVVTMVHVAAPETMRQADEVEVVDMLEACRQALQEPLKQRLIIDMWAPKLRSGYVGCLVRIQRSAVDTVLKLSGKGIWVDTPKSMIEQYTVVWLKQGEHFIGSLKAAFVAVESCPHHGLIWRACKQTGGSQFAARILCQDRHTARQLLQAEDVDGYVIAGMPVDMSLAECTHLLQVAKWDAKIVEQSRRNQKDKASYMVKAAAEPPVWAMPFSFHGKEYTMRIAVRQSKVARQQAQWDSKKKEKENRQPGGVDGAKSAASWQQVYMRKSIKEPTSSGGPDRLHAADPWQQFLQQRSTSRKRQATENGEDQKQVPEATRQVALLQEQVQHLQAQLHQQQQQSAAALEQQRQQLLQAQQSPPLDREDEQMQGQEPSGAVRVGQQS